MVTGVRKILPNAFFFGVKPSKADIPQILNYYNNAVRTSNILTCNSVINVITYSI